MTNEAKVNFVVHNIYAKDVSYEAPHSPKIFTLEWKPKLGLEIEMARNKLEDNLHEVVLSLMVKVEIEPSEAGRTENLTAFILEVKQAGIFMLEGVTDEQQIEYIMSTAAPTILFPYARQVISNMVTQGGFPQLIVPPINFEGMYQQHLQDKAQSREAVTQ